MLTKILYALCSVSAVVGCDGPAHSLSVGSPELTSIKANQISIVVEAKSHPWGLPDSPATICNYRGYLVSAVLDSEHESTSSVIGPLWNISGSTSAVAIETRSPFTPQDTADLNTLPHLSVNASQELVKEKRSEDGKEIIVYTLKFENKSASWGKPQHFDRLFSSYRSFSDWFVTSDSGRYLLVRNKSGKVSLLDQFARKELDDPWLKSTWNDLLAKPDFPNFSANLTEDLKYLVLFLSNRDLRPEGPHVTEFTLDGKSYPCLNHGVIYERSRTPPQVFTCLQDEFGQDCRPISIDGQLLFVGYNSKEWSLRNSAGDIIKSIRPTSDLSWIKRVVFYHHDPIEHRIIVYRKPSAESMDSGAGLLDIAVWYYKSDTFKTFSVEIGSLFEEKSDGFYPKNVIPIESGDLPVEK